MELVAILAFISFSLSLLAVITYVAKQKLAAELDKYRGLYSQITEEKTKLEQKLEELNQNLFQISEKKNISETRLVEMEKRIEDFELAKKNALENAKAAIFEVGGKLSSKLIEEHKRESEQAKKERDAKFKETTEKFNKDFENIVKTVATLNEQVKESRSKVDIVNRALLAPTSAGSLAEITLENILKNSGLIEGVDFALQYSIIGSNDQKLRPDAVIFLPAGNLMVIDSKASKFFLEIAKATNEEKSIVETKLLESMRKHVKSLISRDYKDGIREHLKQNGHIKSVKHVSIVMFLPTESALERLQNLDSKFVNNAWQNNIYPAGPVGLVNILAHAKFQIAENLKADNFDIITEEVSGLLSSIATIYEYARKVGVSIQGASNNFDKFAASFNSKILAKAKKLNKLGVRLNQNKPLPQMLDRYQLIKSGKMSLIENEDGEKNEDDDIKMLEELN